MVTRREKLRAIEFIAVKLVQSGLYVVQQVTPTDILFQERDEVRKKPRTIEVVIANFLANTDQYIIKLLVNFV